MRSRTLYWWIMLAALITICLPNGTFWEIASFIILAGGTLLVIGKFFRWTWPYLWRSRQFRREISPDLCSGDYNTQQLPSKDKYDTSQTLSVVGDGTITFLLRLKTKQKQVDFGLRYLGKDGKDFPNSVIELTEVNGFRVHLKYWNIDGHRDYEGGLRGIISYPSRRDAEKDCYMRITAQIRQSCCGILRFEGRYLLEDGRPLSAKSEARLNIQFTPLVPDKEGSQA